MTAITELKRSERDLRLTGHARLVRARLKLRLRGGRKSLSARRKTASASEQGGVAFLRIRRQINVLMRLRPN